MPENINLIPSEVIKERSMHATYNRFLFVSILVLVLTGLGIAGLLYINYTKQQELNSVTKQVSQKKEELKSLEDVQKNGSILTAKLAHIDSLLTNKIYYSRLLDEIKNRQTEGIVLNSVNINSSFEVSFSGSAANTVALQRYVTHLIEEPDNLFSDAKILAVSIKEDTGLTTFGITVVANKEMLTGLK